MVVVVVVVVLAQGGLRRGGLMAACGCAHAGKVGIKKGQEYCRGEYGAA